MAFPTSAVPGAYSDGESAVSDVTDELAVEVLKRIGGTRLSVRYTGAFGVRDEENALKTGRASMIGYTSALDDSSVLRVGPVMTDSVDLVVNADAGFSDLSSLRGATICEVFSGLTAAVKNAVGGPMTVVQANTLAECLQKQRSGTVDVVVMSTFGIDELLRQEPGRHRFIDLPLPGVPVGFAVGRGDIEGKAALEEALQSMIDDGTWRRILSGALAATGADVPKPPTIGLFDR